MIVPRISEGESAWDRQMRKIWTTFGSRLEAARRLNRSGQASRWVVTLSSLALVVLSVVLGTPTVVLVGDASDVAKMISLIGPISILIVSAIEYSKAYEVRADRHHRAALALNDLYDVAAAKKNPVLGDLVQGYHEILARFDENHEPIDYYMFATRQGSDFDANWWDLLKTKTLWHLAGQRAWVMVLGVTILFAILLRWAS